MCPVCRVRVTTNYQYQQVCHKCWPGVRNYPEAAQQLQYRLMFMEAMRKGTPVANSTMVYLPQID